MNHSPAKSPHTCQSISDAFLALHADDGFAVLPPSSLLHESVPMSFVMSAGLIQVENDLEQIVEETGGRFVFTQPCFRHFDVKQVGLDTTHLSLFHMSAAFHIGCSDRVSVLSRLWHFLTDILQLDKKRLWITYLDDVEFGIDQRTYDCWKAIGVEEKQLIGSSEEDCFWRQKSTGKIASDGKKCGPHTEVFFERDGYQCNDACQLGNPGACRCGRFVEVSNSLFIENYISDQNTLVLADTVFSECVIGIERLAMVLQDAPNVHGVDRFQQQRQALRELAMANNMALPPEFEQHSRVILDHLDAFVTLSADGAPAPGRGGQARIMRLLARGIMTRCLLIGFDVTTLFTTLLPSQSLPTQRLILEWQIFKKTLLKGHRQLQYYSQPLTPEQLYYFKRELGIPELLMDQLNVLADLKCNSAPCASNQGKSL